MRLRILRIRPTAGSDTFRKSVSRQAGWTVYEAFSAPGRILIQVAEMPDGKRYFWIARTVSHGGHGCRICERTDCAQRARPPAVNPLTVDPDHRTRIPYPVLGDHA